MEYMEYVIKFTCSRFNRKWNSWKCENANSYYSPMCRLLA